MLDLRRILRRESARRDVLSRLQESYLLGGRSPTVSSEAGLSYEVEQPACDFLPGQRVPFARGQPADAGSIGLAFDPHHVFNRLGDRVQVTDDRDKLVLAGLSPQHGEGAGERVDVEGTESLKSRKSAPSRAPERL